MSDAEERVEQLEAKVGRLEATVQGLTEELVEVHDRLQTLEAERTDAAGTTGDRTRTREDTNESDGSKSAESQEEDETGGDSELGDDIIVA